jgi:hypothetical protein
MGVLSSLILKDNRLLTAEAGKVLSDMLATNTMLKVLDLSSSNWQEHGTHGDLMGDGSGFAKELAVGISDNGAISSVNLLDNDIPMEQVKALASILKEHPTLKSLCGNSGEETELDMSGKIIGAEGAIMLAPEIAGNRALTSLHVGQSNIPENEMREIMAIAMRMDSMKILCEIPFKDKTLTELDVSGKNLGTEGALVVAEYFDGNGALSITNVMGNSIGKEMFSKLQEIMRSKPNLISLCGIADDATEVDLSGLGMGADDAVILASELPDKGALLCLDISNNCIGDCDELPEGWSLTTYPNSDYRYTHLDGRHQANPPPGSKSRGVTAIADAIRDNRALTKLDISRNYIGAAQEGELQRICLASGIELAK